MNWGYKPPKGKINLREQMLRNQKALDTYASLAEKPPLVLDIPPAPKKRAPSQPSERPLEKDVQKAILSMIRWRTDVVFYGRFNRGSAVYYGQDGKPRHVVFNTVPGFSDIHGMLKTGRAFYIECKRDGKEKATADQLEFIDKVKAGGGIAGVAWTVEMAEDILNERTRP
jgi:hypothetical protein